MADVPVETEMRGTLGVVREDVAEITEIDCTCT